MPAEVWEEKLFLQLLCNFEECVTTTDKNVNALFNTFLRGAELVVLGSDGSNFLLLSQLRVTSGTRRGSVLTL